MTFEFPMTPEAKAKAVESTEWARRKRSDFATMSDESLISNAQFCMRQMTPIDLPPGAPVYDATMWHVILPELMRRVGKKAGA